VPGEPKKSLPCPGGPNSSVVSSDSTSVRTSTAPLSVTAGACSTVFTGGTNSVYVGESDSRVVCTLAGHERKIIEVREKDGTTRTVGRVELTKTVPSDDLLDMTEAMKFIEHMDMFHKKDKTGKWTAAKADTVEKEGSSRKLLDLCATLKDEPHTKRAPKPSKVLPPIEKNKGPLPSLEEVEAILEKQKEWEREAKRAQRAPEPKPKEYDSWDELDDLSEMTPECKAEYDKILARDFPEFSHCVDVEPDSPIVVSSSNNEQAISEVVTKESVTDENANMVEPRHPVVDAVLSSVMTKEVSNEALTVEPVVPSCDDCLPNDCRKDVVESVEDQWPSDFTTVLADMPYGLDEETGPTVEQEISRPYIVAKEMLGSLERSLMGPPVQEPKILTPIERGMQTPSAESIRDVANADDIHGDS